jgi:hypothetical protein
LAATAADAELFDLRRGSAFERRFLFGLRREDRRSADMRQMRDCKSARRSLLFRLRREDGITTDDGRRTANGAI